MYLEKERKMCKKKKLFEISGTCQVRRISFESKITKSSGYTCICNDQYNIACYRKGYYLPKYIIQKCYSKKKEMESYCSLYRIPFPRQNSYTTDNNNNNTKKLWYQIYIVLFIILHSSRGSPT